MDTQTLDQAINGLSNTFGDISASLAGAAGGAAQFAFETALAAVRIDAISHLAGGLLWLAAGLLISRFAIRSGAKIFAEAIALGSDSGVPILCFLALAVGAISTFVGIATLLGTQTLLTVVDPRAGLIAKGLTKAIGLN